MARLVVAAAMTALAALAHGGGPERLTQVSASFSATAVSGDVTGSCTTAAGAVVSSTIATYAGIAAGDLAGPARIAARSTIDVTDGIGVVSGTLSIGGARARFSAVYDHGRIAGTASGTVGRAHAQLLANLSSRFSPGGGFTGGRLGGGAGGGAVVVVPGACSGAPSPRGARAAAGTIAASNAASITVAGLTCAVPAALAMKVAAGYPAGTRARITCAVRNGAETLVTIRASR
jgi:hypothetical protein